MIVNNSHHNTIQARSRLQSNYAEVLFTTNSQSFLVQSGISYVEVINDRWGQGFIKALNTNISAIPNEAVSIK